MTPTALLLSIVVLIIAASIAFLLPSANNVPPKKKKSKVFAMPSEQEIQLPNSKAPGLFSQQESNLAVVLTHPWGPLGGNLHNNVVVNGARYFQKLGISTLRFDFVGWQLSWGNYQAQQVEEAAKFLMDNSSATKILLVGYSYGSLLAASASANIPECVGVVSIAPPWAVKHWLLLFHSNHHVGQAASREDLPKLFLIGDHDNFTTLQVFEKTLEQFPTDSTTSKVLANSDHFFRRREPEVFQMIGEWLLQIFPKCEGDLKKLATSEVYDSS